MLVSQRKSQYGSLQPLRRQTRSIRFDTIQVSGISVLRKQLLVCNLIILMNYLLVLKQFFLLTCRLIPSHQNVPLNLPIILIQGKPTIDGKFIHYFVSHIIQNHL